MLHVYLNYPNARITAHRNAGCSAIRTTRKTGQRLIRLDAGSLTMELRKFDAKEYVFASHAQANDMWAEIDLADEQSERAALRQIHRSLSRYYTRFRRAAVRWHC